MKKSFDPGPPSTSRKRRRAIGHRDAPRKRADFGGPMIFTGASGAQVKGPIVFHPPSPYQSVRNKYLQAPGFTMRRIA